MNITLRQLRAFCEVAQSGGFTQAARRMHLTQSAVSMLIRQLETDIGLALFDRVKRAVRLTETGQQLLPIAQRILGDLREVVDGAADLRALRRGTLRLAVPQMLACSWLPPVLAQYRGLYPEIAVTVTDTTADRVVDTVGRGEAELGIGPERPVPEGVQADLLWQERIQCVCAADSPLARRDMLVWADVADAEWILYSDTFSGHLERTVWSGMSVHLPRTTQVRYLPTALALVGRGMGVTAAPGYAEPFGRLFGAAFIDIASPVVMRSFHIYAKKGYELSPAARAFRQLAERTRP
ncbi:LysR family transcriptional regulator [Ferrovibrio sp.]|uniref:LysR family transcriptional regulator n=1 Tax=Ferrovibrio sp. TaxID=1917215 RepID=UPI00311E3D75